MTALTISWLLLGCSPRPPARPPREPVTEVDKILLVVLDDVGAAQVGAYGRKRRASHTPRLDALADAGRRFETVWAAAVCSATRAAILTGRFGSRTGIETGILARNPTELPLAEFTVPELLAGTGRGWSTAYFGKWHLGSPTAPSGARHPNLQGFDHFEGTLGNLGTSGGGYRDYEVVVDGRTERRTDFATTRVVDDALSWIASAAPPWFVQVGFHAVHEPLEAPPPELVATPLPPDPTPRALYDANLEAADHELGRLVDGAGPGTLVLVIGDNGPPAEVVGGNPAKQTLFERGLRVPLIVSGPGVGRPGVPCEGLAQAVDLFPTLGALTGARRSALVPPGAADPVVLDGVSLVPCLLDPESGVDRPLLYAEVGCGQPGCVPTRAVRTRHLKLIRWPDQQAVFTVSGYDETPVDLSTLDDVGLASVARLTDGLDAIAASLDAPGR